MACSSSAACSGILVRTGKYRPSDEAGAKPRADLVADDFHTAVLNLLESDR